MADSSVDCVLSNCGIIFASDAGAAASEISRVLTTEGRVVFTAWLPGGAAGALSAAAQDLVRAALGAGSAAPGFAWHDVTAVAKLFSDHSRRVEQRAPHQTAFTASSPEVYLDTELNNHPLAMGALKVLRDRGVDKAGRERLLQVVKAENEDPRGFRSTAQYVVLVGRRAAAQVRSP